MTLTTRPGMTDDDGTGQSGTAVNEAFIDLIFDQVDDQVHSTTNPTIKPKATTDEVVTARGSLGTLDARLDVSLNNDGTLKTQADLVTVSQAVSLAGQQIVLRNKDLKSWPNGIAAAPQGWAYTNATAARCGPGDPDTTHLGAGVYAAKITWTSGAGEARYIIVPGATWFRYESIEGQTFQFGIWVKTSIASHVRLKIDDGAAVAASAYHTGSGNAEFLTVEKVISASATKLDVLVEIASAGSGYFQGPMAFFGDLSPEFWSPYVQQLGDEYLDGLLSFEDQGVGGLKTFMKAPRFSASQLDTATALAYVRGTLDRQLTTVGNVGAGEDDLHTYSLPANSLNTDEQIIRVTARGTFAANGNTKTYRVFFGATGYTLHATTTSGGRWKATVDFVRTGAATQTGYGEIALQSSGLTLMPTIVSPTETLSGAVTIKTTGQSSGSATDDIVETFFMVEVLPG